MKEKLLIKIFAITILAILMIVTLTIPALAEEQQMRPIPGWKREAPGPWLHSGYGGYDETSNRYNPYSTAPETPHVLWKRQVNFGGVVGGETGESFFLRGGYPIVFGGSVFYVVGQMRKQAPAQGQGGWAFPGGAQLIRVDQYTGEEIYTVILPGNNSFASTLQAAFDTSWRGHTMSQTIFVSGNGGIWAINAVNGETTWYINLQNAKIKYQADTNNLIGMWWQQGAKDRTVINYNVGEEGRITAPFAFELGKPDPTKVVWNISKGQPSHVILVDEQRGFFTHQKPKLGIKAFDIETGDILWSKVVNWTGPPSSHDGKVFVNIASDLEFEGGHVQEVVAYDIITGNQIWQTNIGFRESPWFGFGHATAYGKVYVPSYDGHVYAINEETGAVVWKFFAGNHSDYVYGHYPFHMGPTVADGKVYIASEDNAPPQPMVPGNKLYCLDAETGEEIWSIAGAGGGKGQEIAIADGMLLFTDTYTGQMFNFAKGPTAIEVSVKNQAIPEGDYTWITGTIADQSPAQIGAPVVAKDSMEEYMSYLHEGFPMPDEILGVPVMLKATDANGNEVNIGEVTSDDQGYFSYKWTPPDEDLYTITATFEGDDSYWSSSAMTDLQVGPAPTPEPTPTPEPLTDTYVLGMGAAAIAAIVVIGLVLIMMMRKK